MQLPSTIVEWSQTRCRVALGRCQITPPVGIYHRMWGAATHERATGVHRPLTATMLWLEPEAGDSEQALVIAALDHVILDEPDLEGMRAAISRSVGVDHRQVLITLSHTHAAGLMSRSRATCAGGELIGPYLDSLADRLAELAAATIEKLCAATIVYGTGRSALAAHRDFFDAQRQQFVCGFNPAGPADDTMLVGRIVADHGELLGTLVNYACHPTTLAWQNTLISPDYVGAMRETIEHQTGAPCLFLQGASADLGPREGYVGDPAIADRNGRQLAFAALSALEGLPTPGSRFLYTGPVVSGATIGTWRHESVDEPALDRQRRWQIEHLTVPLAYRTGLPSLADAEAERTRWQREETAAEAAGERAQARDCHARVERAERQIWRLMALPPDRFPLPVTVARLGGADWLFVAGEHYQSLQTTLRGRSPERPLLIATLTNGWQPGYIPPTSIYGRGIYQEQIAVVAPGSAEQVLKTIVGRLAPWSEDPSPEK